MTDKHYIATSIVGRGAEHFHPGLTDYVLSAFERSAKHHGCTYGPINRDGEEESRLHAAYGGDWVVWAASVLNA